MVNWSKREQQFNEWGRMLSELQSSDDADAMKAAAELAKACEIVRCFYVDKKLEFESGMVNDKAALKATFKQKFDSMQERFDEAAIRFGLQSVNPPEVVS